MRRASKLNLSRGQKTSLESLMNNTTNKKEYRRVLAILQKVEGRSYEDIAHEHEVNIRSRTKMGCCVYSWWDRSGKDKEETERTEFTYNR